MIVRRNWSTEALYTEESHKVLTAEDAKNFREVRRENQIENPATSFSLPGCLWSSTKADLRPAQRAYLSYFP